MARWLIGIALFLGTSAIACLWPRPALAAPFRVTVGQVRLTRPDDVLAQVERTFKENPSSELFVFPEFVTHGDRVDLDQVAYLKGDAEARATAEKWIKLTPRFGQVKKLAQEHGKAVVVGCLEQERGKLFSRAYFFDPSRSQLLHYDKSHVHWTETYLRPGNRLEPLATRFGRLGFLICYDLAFVEPTRVLGLKGAEVLLVMSAIPMHFHWKYPMRRAVGAAIFNQYYVLAANLGHTLAAPMGGHSAIVDAEGDVMVEMPGTEAGHISAVVDLETEKQWREQEVIGKYRRPALYEIVSAPVKTAD